MTFFIPYKNKISYSYNHKHRLFLCSSRPKALGEAGWLGRERLARLIIA
jgi:hypothetical protein